MRQMAPKTTLVGGLPGLRERRIKGEREGEGEGQMKERRKAWVASKDTERRMNKELCKCIQTERRGGL